jgi:hypothetical protein
MYSGLEPLILTAESCHHDRDAKLMSLGSGRSRVADLSLRVYSRGLHPDWFRTLAFRRVVQTGWEADIRLIAGGHAILFASGSARVAEILSAPAAGGPTTIYDSALRAERMAHLHPAPGVEYQTCFAVERADHRVFAHLCRELELEADPQGLFHRQRADNRLEAAPLSRLRVEVRPRSLSVHAFHTLPDERAIIRIQSLLELKP